MTTLVRITERDVLIACGLLAAGAALVARDEAAAARRAAFRTELHVAESLDEETEDAEG